MNKPINSVDKYEAAVVIGLYRQGATWEQICAAMHYDIVTLKIVVAKYLKRIAIAL